MAGDVGDKVAQNHPAKTGCLVDGHRQGSQVRTLCCLPNLLVWRLSAWVLPVSQDDTVRSVFGTLHDHDHHTAKEGSYQHRKIEDYGANQDKLQLAHQRPHLLIYSAGALVMQLEVGHRRAVYLSVE